MQKALSVKICGENILRWASRQRTLNLPPHGHGARFFARDLESEPLVKSNRWILRRDSKCHGRLLRVCFDPLRHESRANSAATMLRLYRPGQLGDRFLASFAGDSIRRAAPDRAQRFSACRIVRDKSGIARRDPILQRNARTRGPSGFRATARWSPGRFAVPDKPCPKGSAHLAMSEGELDNPWTCDISNLGDTLHTR